MRPEWIRCIQKIKRVSFCGEGEFFSWRFIDLQHALRAISNDDRLVPCDDCLRIAKDADCS